MSIVYDNAIWAFSMGTALALMSGETEATKTAMSIGEGLQSFTIPGSIAINDKWGEVMDV